MRIPVGKVVDVSKEVNLADLKPLDRIIAATIQQWRSTSWYKRRVADTEEAREEKRRAIILAFQKSILAAVQRGMRSHPMEGAAPVNAVLLEIPYRYNEFLETAIKSRDFDIYDCRIVTPSRALSKFAKPPTLLYVVQREVVEYDT